MYQDYLDWEMVEVEIVNLSSDKGELNWYWGNIGEDYDPSWKKFTYQFRVAKEDGKWKISYLEGFEFNESIKSDGEI